jgi:serine/threonine protein kinase
MISVHAGEKLDHFQIDRLVARSGMASIFQGTDLRTGQTVAIKIPHPQMECDPVFFERFQREEEIGKKLDHPGVMKVIPNEGRHDPYIVMEWVPGKLLRQIMAETGKMPQQRAIDLVLKICRALEHIHSHGVIHRDLKPENIMVDDNDNIKIIDFGISANSGARRITFAKLTDTMGTPDYISPEQVKGGRGDARSDVYALGVMLYEMLTGTTPFTGDNPFAIMNDRLLNNPVPPREHNPEISSQLQEVLYRTLEREPRNRYRSARDFAFDLQHLDQVGVEERPEMTNWKRRRSPWGRRIAMYVALALIPIIIFALLLFVAKHA